jgi:hypothetical protein
MRKIVCKMKAKKVAGVDDIDSYSLKLSFPFIEEAVLSMVNRSLADNTFPWRWKPQLITPLHKKASKEEVKNYRPVSFLVQVGKIIELVVYSQIVQHFEKNGLWHDDHHGGIPHLSTCTAMGEVYEACIEAVEDKEMVAIVMLDQSAAFDLLSHSIFEEKLRHYKFEEQSISWILSFLQGRSQAVQVQARRSSFIMCEDYGVPQGSVLGGLFHNLNTLDYPVPDTQAKRVVFVDDGTSIVSGKTPEEL